MPRSLDSDTWRFRCHPYEPQLSLIPWPFKNPFGQKEKKNPPEPHLLYMGKKTPQLLLNVPTLLHPPPKILRHFIFLVFLNELGIFEVSMC